MFFFALFSVLWVYNSLPYSRYELVSVRVNRHDVVAQNSDGTPIESQLNPIISTSGVVMQKGFEVIFLVKFFVFHDLR